jgi:hypothetical protein
MLRDEPCSWTVWVICELFEERRINLINTVMRACDPQCLGMSPFHCDFHAIHQSLVHNFQDIRVPNITKPGKRGEPCQWGQF